MRFIREKNGSICRFAFSRGHCLFFMLYLAETEIHQRKNYGNINRQININHHSPIPLATVAFAIWTEQNKLIFPVPFRQTIIFIVCLRIPVSRTECGLAEKNSRGFRFGTNWPDLLGFVSFPTLSVILLDNERVSSTKWGGIDDSSPFIEYQTAFQIFSHIFNNVTWKWSFCSQKVGREQKILS